METKKILKYLHYAVYFFGGILCLLIVLSFLHLEATKKPLPVRERILSDQKNLTKVFTNLPQPWPPLMNKGYPDFSLIDQDGKSFKLSDLRGKVILIENVDMTSPLSQAYSGAHTYGQFGAKTQEVDAKAVNILDMLPKYSEGLIKLPSPDVIIVKIIYYNSEAKQPTPVDATNWAEHFKLTKANNIIVAVPEKDMRSTLTSSILPGFQVLDRAFNLRVDSTGGKPKHSLEMTLIPLIPKLI